MLSGCLSSTTNWCSKVRIPDYLSLRSKCAHWCGNPPVRAEMFRKLPRRLGFTAIFGGNRYLVPFIRGIATTWSRNDRYFWVQRAKHQFVRFLFFPKGHRNCHPQPCGNRFGALPGRKTRKTPGLPLTLGKICAKIYWLNRPEDVPLRV